MVGNWKFKTRGLIYGLVGTLPLMSSVALLKSLRVLLLVSLVSFFLVAWISSSNDFLSYQ